MTDQIPAGDIDFTKDEAQLLKQIELARKELEECNAWMQKTQRSIPALSIDLTTLEINIYMKKLFLADQYKLKDEMYKYLSDQISERFNIFWDLVENKFGREKKQKEVAK